MGLMLTTEQVAQKLGVHKSVVIRLTRQGKIPTVNPSTDGRRVAHRFDPKVVREFQKTYVPMRRGPYKLQRAAASKAVEGPGAIRQQLSAIQDAIQESLETRLSSLEDKIQQLIAMWS